MSLASKTSQREDIQYFQGRFLPNLFIKAVVKILYMYADCAKDLPDGNVDNIIIVFCKDFLLCSFQVCRRVFAAQAQQLEHNLFNLKNLTLLGLHHTSYALQTP